ncbi:ABC transporter ATP-binding protein [Paenibacillus sophorae]|uniref:ABC transporter ATP-binding protein n=1 Tax=Paenibacillus sophorae TaxID=1333845 RepID=UPI0020C91BF7|nr:ABC transporter ATP-binding protein [Paenibacillus sophorae]
MTGADGCSRLGGIKLDFLSINQVSKRIGGKNIIKNVSLSVPKGKIFGLLGPNGAGKTTLIKMMVGIMKMSSGDIRIGGSSIQSEFKDAIRKVGAVIENPSFYGEMTGFQNLRYISAFHMKPNKVNIERQLEAFGLSDSANKRVKKYSLGMKQRLGLAVSLLHNPDLVILDEPTNGMDPQGIIDLRRILRGLAEKHEKTVFLSSHLLSEVELLCDYYGVMNDGELLEIKENGRAANEFRYTLSFDSTCIKRAMQLLTEAGYQVKRNEAAYELSFVLPEEKIMIVINMLNHHQIEVLNMKQARWTLEEDFIALLNANKGAS